VVERVRRIWLHTSVALRMCPLVPGKQEHKDSGALNTLQKQPELTDQQNDMFHDIMC
jgi:hypothetical protein